MYNGWSSGGLSAVDIQNPQSGDTLLWNASNGTSQNTTNYISSSPASANVDFASNFNNVTNRTVNLTPTGPFDDAFPNIISSSMDSNGKYTFPVSGVYYYKATMLATPSAGGNQITTMNAVVNTAVGNNTRQGIVVQQGSAYYGEAWGITTFNKGNNLTFQVVAGGTQSTLRYRVSVYFLYAVPQNNTFVLS